MFLCAADPLRSIQCYLKQTHLKEVSLCFPSTLVPSSSLPLWTLSLSQCTQRVDLDAMFAPLDSVFIPDVLIWTQGSPEDSDPNYPFELLYFLLLWESSSNQFFTQLHSTPNTGAPCKAVVYSLGSLILFTWFSQMSRDAWFLRNKITRSYNLKT